MYEIGNFDMKNSDTNILLIRRRKNEKFIERGRKKIDRKVVIYFEGNLLFNMSSSLAKWTCYFSFYQSNLQHNKENERK